MSTPWSLIRRAHEGDPSAARDAQRELIERYRRAAYRYLLRAVRSSEAAEELFQEFAFRLIRGDFRNANPSAGRFRDYLRASLGHMINDHRRYRQRSPRPLQDDVPAPTPPPRDDEEDFMQSWRTEMLNHAWAKLETENATQHAVLAYHVQHPDSTASELSQAISTSLGKSLKPSNVRVTLHRARERFAEALLEEVAQTLDCPTREELAEELRALDLLKLCRRPLQSWPGRQDANR
jgi:RNA polymerase sigma-70 factor (ECF subfamily)